VAVSLKPQRVMVDFLAHWAFSVSESNIIYINEFRTFYSTRMRICRLVRTAVIGCVLVLQT
jgi:hypothetical protein